MNEQRVYELEQKVAVQEVRWQTLGASMTAQTEALIDTNRQLAAVNLQLQVMAAQPALQPQINALRADISKHEALINQTRGGIGVAKYLIGALAAFIGWCAAHAPEWIKMAFSTKQ